MTTEIQPGTYRHYKGALYKVTGTAKHSETEEVLVVYQTLYGDYSWWVRPLAMFLEEVEHQGAQVQRFALIESEDNN